MPPQKVRSLKQAEWVSPTERLNLLLDIIFPIVLRFHFRLVPRRDQKHEGELGRERLITSEKHSAKTEREPDDTPLGSAHVGHPKTITLGAWALSTIRVHLESRLIQYPIHHIFKFVIPCCDFGDYVVIKKQEEVLCVVRIPNEYLRFPGQKTSVQPSTLSGLGGTNARALFGSLKLHNYPRVRNLSFHHPSPFAHQRITLGPGLYIIGRKNEQKRAQTKQQ